MAKFFKACFSKLFSTPSSASEPITEHTGLNTTLDSSSTTPIRRTSNGTMRKFYMRLSRFISNIFRFAVILIIVGHFVPEIHDKIPSLYVVVDYILFGIEWIFKLFLQLFQ